MPGENCKKYGLGSDFCAWYQQTVYSRTYHEPGKVYRSDGKVFKPTNK
jgi:hypothetical protein